MMTMREICPGEMNGEIPLAWKRVSTALPEKISPKANVFASYLISFLYAPFFGPTYVIFAPGKTALVRLCNFDGRSGTSVPRIFAPTWSRI